MDYTTEIQNYGDIISCPECRGSGWDIIYAEDDKWDDTSQGFVAMCNICEGSGRVMIMGASIQNYGGTKYRKLVLVPIFGKKPPEPPDDDEGEEKVPVNV